MVKANVVFIIWICFLSVYLGVQMKVTGQVASLPKNRMATYPFSVYTEPSNSKVRILNIKPVYRKGMALAEGAYKIDVSSPNYITQRAWVKHTSKKQSLVIRLKPRRSQ